MSYTQADIKACRFEYEYMGYETTDLAAKYGFPHPLLLNEIETHSWQRKLNPIGAPLLEDSEGIKDLAENLTSSYRSKLAVAALYDQAENQPLLAEIERMLMVKVLAVASMIDTSDVKSSSKLLNLVRAVNEIQSRQPISLSTQTEEETTSQPVKLNIYARSDRLKEEVNE